jgi:alpha-glucosidase
LFFDAPEPVLWFERRDGNQSLQAIFNLGSEPVSIPLREVLVPLTGHPLPEAGTVQTEDEKRMLTLAPYGVFLAKPADEGQS